ncbi:MAG: hypothetical protein ACFN0X_08745 [Mitsuokella sp.]
MMGRIGQVAVCLICFFMLFAASVPAEAAEGTKPMEKGALLDTDFAYRGVALGDTEEKLLAVYGEPLFDRIMRKQGVTVKVCTFHGHIDVGVSVRTRRVVDFVMEDDPPVMRAGVRRGATKHLIWATYGKTERRFLDGKLAYVYTRPGHPHDHLVLFLDPETESLASVRLTSLPLTEEEADARAGEEAQAEADDGSDLKGMDDSALPHASDVKLGGVLP